MMTAASDKPSDQLAGLLSRLHLERLQELPLQRFAIPGVLALIAFYTLETYKEDQLKKVNGLLNRAKDDGLTLQTKIAGYKTYDSLKKTLDEDELLIRTKLETIHTLIANRAAPPKLLRGISASIPKEAWLTEFKIADADVMLKGQAYGFGQISDFMKTMTDHPLIGKVELKSSNQVNDPDFGEIAGFELTVKRR